MALPVNDKKANAKQGSSTKGQSKGSKFIKGASKVAGPAKIIRSTGANRGS